MRRVGLLAVCALLSQSGCSAFVGSMAHHNSRGTSCMDEPAFPAIDLVGGSLGAVALVYTGTAEESPGWLAVPGVFILSGLIASATVYACRNPDPDETGGGVARRARTEDLPPNNVIPVEDRPKEESDVRDATLEERGMSIPVFAPPVDTKPPPPKEEPTNVISSRINPLTSCPENWSCVLTERDSGVCRPDSERSLPNTRPPRS